MRISDHTLNRLAITKAILRHGPVARTDLPGLTGLSGGLITHHTSELVERGLVSETKDAASRRGRPRVFLEIDGQGAVVIGASIDGQGNLLAAFVSLAGEKLLEDREPFPNPRSLPHLAELIGQALARIMARSPIPKDRIARIGIALPAVIDSVRGEVHFNTTFPVEATPFAAPIAAIVGVPVTIENDMDCQARAEHWFGRAAGADDFVLIRVGFSVDAAEFANGVPKSGSNGLNSSFGHIKTDIGPDRRACFCGAAGCVSAYASAYGILAGANLLTDLPFPPIEGLAERFDALLERARAGDAGSAAAIEEAGRHLGFAVGTCLNVSNPARVFIAVDNADFLGMLQAPFEDALVESAMPGILPLTTITFMQTGEDWRWSGTAALALEQMYLEDHRNEHRLARREPSLAGARED